MVPVRLIAGIGVGKQALPPHPAGAGAMAGA